MGWCTHGCRCPRAPTRDQPPPTLQESEDDDEEEEEEEDDDEDEDDDDDNGDSSEEGGDSSESSSEEESEDGDEVRLRCAPRGGRWGRPGPRSAPIPLALPPPRAPPPRWGASAPGSDRSVAEELPGRGRNTGRRRGAGSPPARCPRGGCEEQPRGVVRSSLGT